VSWSSVHSLAARKAGHKGIHGGGGADEACDRFPSFGINGGHMSTGISAINEEVQRTAGFVRPLFTEINKVIVGRVTWWSGW
jgi:hypothetical protein